MWFTPVCTNKTNFYFSEAFFLQSLGFFYFSPQNHDFSSVINKQSVWISFIQVYYLITENHSKNKFKKLKKGLKSPVIYNREIYTHIWGYTYNICLWQQHSPAKLTDSSVSTDLTADSCLALYIDVNCTVSKLHNQPKLHQLPKWFNFYSNVYFYERR